MPRSFAAAGQDRELPQIVLWVSSTGALRITYTIFWGFLSIVIVYYMPGSYSNYYGPYSTLSLESEA